MNYIIIGVHKSLREVVVWAGKDGFVPILRSNPMDTGIPAIAKPISGDVAEHLMSHITKPGRKYDFVLVPVTDGVTGTGEVKSEAGLILPHLR